ncbi:hypothetical protein [Alteromonas gilva]|uniref:DUF4064 domain-containing protein n=1 Tax=Alteromonas gilva TaxID=2987522 RepID=A0ABT5L3D2_9ALTE|nr:hypothetical protein [Alteromonas gilva]MDC8831011.1 hypothetical protein [Alteromonas gilva]
MKKQTTGRYLAILGLLLFWAPLWGVVETYLLMASSFQEITLFGPNEPKIPQDELRAATINIIQGSLLSLVAIILFVVSVVFLKYRTGWLFWVLIFYSTILLLLFPIGTVTGIIGLVLLIVNRKKFATSSIDS